MSKHRVTSQTVENGKHAPVVRTEFGVERSSCACKVCSFFCKVMPGRLMPPGADPLVWARTHLRAAPWGLLVPARAEPGGPCHWLAADGGCAVHADSPFGCAMFHCGQPAATTDHLQGEAEVALLEDLALGGPYSALWEALWDEGLRDLDTGDGKRIASRYCARLRRQAETRRARARKKAARVQKKRSQRRR
jgi:hypothetical protein